MRHEVHETERLTLTVPPQATEISIDLRFVRVRGRTALVLVDSRNWHVQSQVVHAKRRRKFHPESLDGRMHTEE